MSPVAYLGKPFTLKAYGTFYICPGPVFQYEFNGDVCLVIRLTQYGNFIKSTCSYMFSASFSNLIPTVMMIM
jgi:hypothetical protein